MRTDARRVHSKQRQGQLKTRYKKALEKRGWKYVGQTTKPGKSQSMACKKADGELVVAFGTSQLSEAMGDGSGIDVFSMRKPDGAPGTMLDGYKADGGPALLRAEGHPRNIIRSAELCRIGPDEPIGGATSSRHVEGDVGPVSVPGEVDVEPGRRVVDPALPIV